jgi:hypothetical protein
MTLSSSGYGFEMKDYMGIEKPVGYLKFTKSPGGKHLLDKVEIFPVTLHTIGDFEEYFKVIEQIKTFLENK